MSFEYPPEVITKALIEAWRDGEPEEVALSLAKLLAIHYPGEFEKLQLAVAIAGFADDRS